MWERIWSPTEETTRVSSEPVSRIHISLPGSFRLLTSMSAIMESGNAVGPPWNGTDWYQPMYDRIVNKTG